MIATATVVFAASPTLAQQAAEEPPTQVLFKNVHVFDGTSDSLSGKTNVLVEGNLIKSISSSARARAGQSVIDGTALDEA